MKIRGMRKEDLGAIRHIISVCFGLTTNESDEEARVSIANDKSLLGRNYYSRLVAENEEGIICSSLRIVPYEASFDGGLVKVADIGAVATLPEYRNQGTIRKCFKQAYEELYKKDFAFAYVQAFSTAYYKKFGCAPAADLVVLETKTQKLSPKSVAGSYELVKNDSYGLELVYEQMCKRYSFLQKRGELDWLVFVNKNCHSENTLTYLYRDSNGTPKSFFSFEAAKEGQESILDLKERVYFYDKEGFLAILNFAAMHKEEYLMLKMAFSADAKVDSLVDEHCRIATAKAYRSNGMARCISLKKALEGAAFCGTGRVVLEISDEMIKENNGIFAIEFANGKLSRFYGTNDLPMAKMNIEIFTSLIIGKYDVQDFELIDELEIYDNADMLRKIFYKKRLAAFHCD